MESLEGPQQSWITYKLKAVAERPVFMKDFVQRKHLRVIRTVDPESLELLHEMVSSILYTPSEFTLKPSDAIFHSFQIELKLSNTISHPVQMVLKPSNTVFTHPPNSL